MKLAEPGKTRVRVLDTNPEALRLRVLQLGTTSRGASACRSWALFARVEDGVMYLKRDIDQSTVHERMLVRTDLAELPGEAIGAIRELLGLPEATSKTPNQLAVRALLGKRYLPAGRLQPLDLSWAPVIEDIEPVAEIVEIAPVRKLFGRDWGLRGPLADLPYAA